MLEKIIKGMLIGTLVLAGCDKKSDSNKQTKQTVTKPAITQRYSNRNHQERLASLKAQLAESKAKIKILDDLAADYITISQDLTEKFGEDNIFLHSALMTMGTLSHYSNTFLGEDGSAALAYSVILPIKAELADPVTKIVPLPFSLERFSGLSKGLRSYGVIESGNVWQADKSQLLWKQRLDNTFPTDVYLITSGNYKGFFVENDGDLVIPGICFYQNLLSDKVRISDYPTVDYHFRTHYKPAYDNIAKKNYTSAVEMFRRMLREDKMPKHIRASMHHNIGICFLQVGYTLLDDGRAMVHPDKIKIAVSCFEKAISVDHTLPGPYGQTANCYMVLGKYSTAIRILDTGIANVYDEDRSALFKKKKGIQEIRKRYPNTEKY